MKIEKIGVFKDFTDNSIMSIFNLGKNKRIEMLLLDQSKDIDIISVPTHYCCNLEENCCEGLRCNCNDTRSMEKIDIKELQECLISSLTKQNTDEKRTDKNKLQIVFDGVGDVLLNIDLLKEVYLNEDSIKSKLGYKQISYVVTTIMPKDHIKKLIDVVDKLNIPIKLEFLVKNELDIKEKLDCLQEYYLVIKENKKIKEKNDKFNKNSPLVELVYPLYNIDKSQIFNFCNYVKDYDFSIKFLIVNSKVEDTNEEKYCKLINEISEEYLDLRVKLEKIYGLEVGGIYKNLVENNFCYDKKTESNLWKVRHQIYEQQRSDYLSWDEYFMAVAKLTAMRSKDPNTQVGACIVGDDNRILSIGYNGSPNGYCDECFIWERVGGPLDTKYMYVVHAERNAILNYRGSRRDFEGAKIYVDLFPCNECAKEIIQAGIKEVIYLSDKYAKTDSTIASKRLFDACDVKYRQLNDKKYKDIVLNLNIENE